LSLVNDGKGEAVIKKGLGVEPYFFYAGAESVKKRGILKSGWILSVNPRKSGNSALLYRICARRNGQRQPCGKIRARVAANLPIPPCKTKKQART